MAKRVTALEIRLGPRDGHTTLTRWLLDELRRGILNGSLTPGTRLPATRDLAGQFGLSRGSVVTVFEQLCQDGYLQSRVGAGTWVNDRLPGRIRGGKLHPRVQNFGRARWPAFLFHFHLDPFGCGSRRCRSFHAGSGAGLLADGPAALRP